ncbi:Hemolysin-type calcium binding protein related domain (fragment) [Paraburkholderia ribeironis]|uniref:Hemolysin-type calcium binding protein related domain n=1 Tax=Paraburkholderia ribeironis TaxID=1247936 RepID=A0A1N7S4U2_9BURK
MTESISELLGPILNTINSVGGAVETTIGAWIDSNSTDPATQGHVGTEMGQAAAAVGSAIVTGVGTSIDSLYLTSLGTVLGTGGTASTALDTLPSQLGNLSSSLSAYNDAVASGDQGAISFTGLTLSGSVASVLSSIGGIVSGVADALASAGVIGEAAAAPAVSLGLAISSAAGLFALTATNAVVNAVKNAADAISNLLNDIESQSGTGTDINTGSSSGDAGSQDGSGGGPESGAPGAALGKYEDSTPLISPLVLDLTGSGINLTPLNTSSPYFDLTNDGFARQTGWIGTGTGLLCFDPNDQNITNITQLFGNATTDGFDILRQLDTNRDNVINASDAAFASLRVWIDTNSNGVTDPGELYTLGQLGIVSINLNATAVNETVAGNSISSISSYTLADGTTHEIADAWFANSTTNTRPVTTVEVTASAATLPQLSGGGTLRDLRSAMTLDQSLQALVQAFVDQSNTTGPSAVESAVQAILFEWAGVTQINPSSRGSYIDARKLGFAEKYLGRPFVGIDGTTNPEIRAGALMQLAWNDLYDGALARLVLQSPLAASTAPEFRYDSISDTVQAASTFAPALGAAFQRLGAITAANLESWDLLLRIADAARFDMGMSVPLFEEYVAAATNDTVASVASAIASGLQISMNASGRIQETGTAIYGDFYAGPGVSLLSAGHADVISSTPLSAHDIFNYAAGDGVIEIREIDSNCAAPANVLQLGTGISASSITVKGTSSSIVLTDGITGDQIALDNEMDIVNNSGVQKLQFADGTVWTKQQLQQMATTGTTGNDKLYGTTGADVFDGKGGNDIEYGYGGGDTFIFNPGYGKLEISDTGSSSSPANVLQLGTGISTSSITVKGTSTSIVLTDGITGDQITLDNEMDIVNNSGVQKVQFADGTVWTKQKLQQMATIGTTGNDTLYGTTGADVFDGKGGNDIEYGYGGNDVYTLQQGYGLLTIYNGTSSNIAAAGELLIKNVDPNEIWLQRVGNNLQVDVMGTKTEATIENWFSYSYSQLAEVAVSGGASGNMVLDTQINQLIQAMATFTANHPGFDPTSSANPTITDPTVLTLVSSTWHN